jgi:hypothetical protein
MSRRHRPRPRRVIVPVLLLAVLAAAVAVLQAAEFASWLAWLPPWSYPAIAAALAVVVAWWFEPWATRRAELSARERAAVDRLRAHLGRQETLARVRDVDPLALRVHQAIPLPDTAATPTGVRPGAAPPAVRSRRRWSLRRRRAGGNADALNRALPTWIDRDRAEEVRRWLGEATETGGFLLLVGDSSVGKTRLLYQAVREVLPDWAILTPDLGDGDLVNTVADATFALPKLVVWLDEIQRFLPGPYLAQTPNRKAVTAASLRRPGAQSESGLECRTVLRHCASTASPIATGSGRWRRLGGVGSRSGRVARSRRQRRSSWIGSCAAGPARTVLGYAWRGRWRRARSPGC